MNKTDRAGIVRGIQEGKSGVARDEEHPKGKGVIYGVGILNKGPINPGDAREWEFDDESLDAVVTLGNKAGVGIKSRFGHPNMSSEALGTYLGRMKNFRRDGEVVRADLFIDGTAYKTPNGDLATYVLDLAENDPKAFGTSLVFEKELKTRVKENGEAQTDEKGNPLPQLVRFTKVFASDVVDEPAATKGLLSTGAKFFPENVMLSAEFTRVLDTILESQDALQVLQNFLERYRVNRGPQEDQTESPKTTQQHEQLEAPQMDLKNLTLEMLQQSRPDLVEKIKTDALSQNTAAGETAKLGAVTAERSRNVSILEKANAYGLEQADALAAIQSGDELGVVEGRFKDKKIAALEANKNKPAGQDTTDTDELDLSTDEGLKNAWDKNPAQREGFSSFETFKFYHKNKGAVRSLKSKK